MNSNQQDSLTWGFPSTGGGPIDGFNDSAREHFEGAHEHHLAREIIQNSLDARSNESSDPVRVVFELRRVQPKDVPGISELETYYKKAAELAKTQDDAAEFYESAIQMLHAKEMLVLRVGDYNTKGLDGSDDDIDGNWVRLTNSEGVSAKKGDGGGSFGIGKAAAFVASGLRTVYYVSRNTTGELVFEGKIKISSFEGEDGDRKRGVGQFGIPARVGIASARGDDKVPEFFHRTDRGTDIFIAGYKPTDADWKDRLIQAIIGNFWAAIHTGDLIVELVGDGENTVINVANLREHLERYADTEDNSLPYYLAFTETDPIVKTLNHLKEVRLYVKLGESLSKRIQMMRRPRMVVETKRIGTLHEDYAAVLICENQIGNDILRDLEPPAHDKWVATRKEGVHKPAMDELQRFLRETLRSLNPQIDDEPEDIPELGKYLPDVEERDDLASLNYVHGEDTDKTTSTETPREVGAVADQLKSKVSAVKKQTLTIVNSARGEDTNRLGIANRTNSTHDDGASEDEAGNLPRVDTTGLDFRSFMTKSNDGFEYHIVLKPAHDSSGTIRIMAIGEDAEYPVDITEARDDKGNNIKISGSFISDISLSEGVPCKFVLKLRNSKRYALGVESHEG